MLTGTAAAAGAAALLPVPSARAGATSRAKRTVAVLGGGMAGLAAAHELVERGFDVTVFERKALGGKARSIPVQGTGKGGRQDLQGEHGFRFFPGFYRNVPDTMRRIPFPGNANGVHDNMFALSSTRVSRNGGRSDIIVPELTAPGGGLDLDMLKETLTGLVEQVAAIPPAELALFVNRFIVFVTSSDERRLGQWERLPWWEYVRAEGKSADYRAIVARFLTRGLVAVKEQVASTRTVGSMGQAFVLSGLGLGADGGLARMLNAPTNEAWIDPWVRHLTGRGVRFEVGQSVEALEVNAGRIRSVRVADSAGRRRTAEADWFVCAVPVERARALLSPGVLALAPELEGLEDLRTEWMNGLQFFLRRTPDGLGEEVNFMDSPWQITAVLQSRLWDGKDFRRDYGDGNVADCLSLDVSDWDTPGILYGRPAKECSPAQVAKECWAQMKDHLEDTGRSVLPDDLLHSWFLDPAISWYPASGRNANDEPLMVNTVGSWANRPGPRTGIPNLFMAGDYVRTSMDLATMESANESGRAAVNALLEAAGAPGEPARVWTLYQPPELDGLKEIDARRYRAGKPHLFDVP
jgi:uncharacterized protein with NAD-binding domain and iron-sulfur cluster